MKLPKFLPLIPPGLNARRIIVNAITLPQRQGTILAQIQKVEADVENCLAEAEQLYHQEPQDEVLLQEAYARLEFYRTTQKMLITDQENDPGGYLVWMWAEGNIPVLKKLYRFRQ